MHLPGALVLVLPAAIGALALGPAPASAADLSVRIEARTPGWLTLRAQAPEGTTLVLRERTAGGAAERVVRIERGTMRRRLATWSCGVRDRRFVVQVIHPQGGVPTVFERGARTPSCARRLAVDTGTARTTRPVRITIRDTFQLGGLTVQACLRTPSGRERCAAGTIPVGKRTTTLDLGRPTPGPTTILVRSDGRLVARRVVRARRPGSTFRVLTTGDSMIQVVDELLAQRVRGGGGRVRFDAHIGTGISKPWLLNWPAHAAATAGGVRPDVTAVLLGANDGFPLGGAHCCSPDWSRAYADRVAGMMRSYLRHGQGRVIWMLLPTPRSGGFAEVFRAVNAGVLAAAERFTPEQVQVLDLRRTFTPDGRYRDGITWQGKYVTVRQPDGLHFNATGARIVAGLLAAQLRADGFLR